MINANKVLSETQTVTEQVSDHIRDCAKLLHEREGEFLTVNEATTLFAHECEISKELASEVLTELVSDTVDPVITVNHEGEKLVGVVDFHEYEGAYGYKNYHDQFGQGKRVVCQQCVNDSMTDADVTHATEGDVNGSFENGASWSELVNAIHQHYNNAHTVSPESVETSVEATGATLVSGTTIGGGTAVHEGFTNDANIDISGDADTLRGNAARNFVDVEEVSSFSDLPTINAPQLAFTTDKNEYYHSFPKAGTKFDIGTSAVTFDTSINTQDSSPKGMTFSASGDRLYEVGQGGDKIYQSTLSTPFDIATATFDTSINSQDSRPFGVAFSASGDRLYVVDRGSDTIFQSTLSTAFDISTATFDTSINSEDGVPQGIAISASGDRLYEVGVSGDKIYQSTLSTAFDIATASFDTSLNSRDTAPKGVAFSASGDRLYEVGNDAKIYQSTLSTAFDIATASFDTSINSEGSDPQDVAFSASGDRLYEIGESGDNIYQSTLTSGGWKQF